MPYVSIFDKIRQGIAGTAAQTPAKAVAWYRNKVRQIAGKTSGALYYSLLQDRSRLTTDAFIGKMVLFAYSAKHKKTLPYWDRFPLVFPIEFYDDGFLGINLHYLEPKVRLVLFDKLLDLSTDKRFDNKTRLILSYKLLSGISRYKEFKPCLKRYLSDHIESQFVQIDAPDWEIALFLPIEKFAKKPRATVWKDSMRIISGVKK